MRLHEELELKQVWIQPSKIGPGNEDKEPWVDLKVLTALSTAVAEAFGCRELVYVNNTPRSGVDKMIPEGREVDCSIRFEHPDITFDCVAERIKGYNILMEGDGPKLVMTIRINGYIQTIADLIEKTKGDPLCLRLKPAQMPLELKKAADAEDKAEEPAEAEAAEEESGEYAFEANSVQ